MRNENNGKCTQLNDNDDCNGSRILLAVCLCTYRGIRKSVLLRTVLDRQERDRQAACKDKFALPSDTHSSTVVFEYAFV